MNANLLRLTPEKTKISIFFHALLSGLLPFLLGASTLLRTLSPFSIAFLASTTPNNIIPALLGSICGIFLFQNEHTVYHIVAAFLIALIRFVLERILTKRFSLWIKCLLCAGISGLCLSFYAIFGRLTTLTITLLLIELILSTSCIPLFSMALQGISRFENRYELLNLEKIGLCLLLVTLLCGCASIKLFGLNIGVMLCAVTILTLAARSGVAGGSIAGILCGAALCLCDSSLADFAVFLAIASFLCGMFQHAGRFVQLLSFLACSVFSLFLMGASGTITLLVISLFIGCAVYLLIPERILLRTMIRQQDELSGDTVFRTRIRFLSNALYTMQEEFIEISDKFDQIDVNNITTVYESASNEICKSCPHCLSCWDARFSETLDAFHPLTQTLRHDGCVTPQTLPRYLKECCRQSDKLCAAINTRYRTFRFKEGKSRALKETRQLMTDGLDTISALLAQMETGISSIAHIDTIKTQKLATTFSEEGINTETVCVFEDHFGRFCAEVYLEQSFEYQVEELAMIASDALDLSFDPPQICTAGSLTRLLFLEEAPFSISFEARQIACGESRICGDSVASFTDDSGNNCFLLSDGMGNGQRAAIDSLMTCSLLQKLLRAGFGTAASLRLLNSALRTKSSDESLATVDLLTVNPTNGQAQFFKAGAAVSLLYRGKRIREIKGTALPLGILQDTDVKPYTQRLTDGDILILLSDGVTDAFPIEAMCPLLNRYEKNDVKEIAFALCSAVSTELHTPCDDITILVVKIEKNHVA